jgi:hypothetical protein
MNINWEEDLIGSLELPAGTIGLFLTYEEKENPLSCRTII